MAHESTGPTSESESSNPMQSSLNHPSESPAATPSLHVRTGTEPLKMREDALNALETYKTKESPKVGIRFRAVGNAPIMRQNAYKIVASFRFQAVVAFLRRELGWRKSEPLFLYVNSSFAPAPDDTVMNLYKSFATEGYLIVNYSTTPAWG